MTLLSLTVTRKWVIYTGLLCCLEEAIIWNSVLNMFNCWWTKKYQKFIKPFYWNYLKQKIFFLYLFWFFYTCFKKSNVRNNRNEGNNNRSLYRVMYNMEIYCTRPYCIENPYWMSQASRPIRVFNTIQTYLLYSWNDQYYNNNFMFNF
jgi:hypothetical protein